MFITIWTAWRNLIEHRVFRSISIAGLAVRMACCILIFLWVRDEQFRPVPPNHERLYRAVMRTEGRGHFDSWA
jgi:hypothetical protein